MDAKWIITAFVLIDTLLERLEHRTHKLAMVPDSEVLTVAVVAAKYFQNHHERALCVLRETHYLPGRIDLTRGTLGREKSWAVPAASCTYPVCPGVPCNP